MRKITIKNPEILDTPFTYVSDQYIGGVSLGVEDSSGFADNDLILIGGVGNEKTETTDLTSAPPNSTTLAITALNFNHEGGESVQKISWDKFDIQYKTSSTGNWISLATGVDFDWQQDETLYIHEDGSSSYYYRSRYYNSATGSYSDWSDTMSGGGYARLQVGFLIPQVRRFAKDENSQAVSDDDIIADFNSATDVVRGLNRRWWFLKTEYDITTVASTATYSLPDDCQRVHRLKYHYNDGSSNIEYYLRYLDPTRFNALYDDLDASDDDSLVHYTVDWPNSQIKVGPTPETSGYTLTLVYFKEPSDVDSYGDTVPVPLADLYINYATARVWKTKDDLNKAKEWMDQFVNSLKILEQMRPKVSHPRSLKIWQGRRAMDRTFGRQGIYSNSYNDSQREKYW